MSINNPRPALSEPQSTLTSSVGSVPLQKTQDVARDENSNPQVSERSKPNNPRQNYFNEFDGDSPIQNPQPKKPSSQEINEEIDLKKNRNRIITGVLVASSAIAITLLGLMAFKVINVSSFILFPGYGASEVVLGMIGILAVSQLSLAFASKSGISKVEEKKSRIYDGVNPSVEEDIQGQKLKQKQENSQESLPAKDQKAKSWRDMLGSDDSRGEKGRGR